MKIKGFLIIVLLGLLYPYQDSRGQSTTKEKGKVNGRTFSYLVVEPRQEVRGIVLLLPGMGESPGSIPGKTQLPRLLAESGYLVILPGLNRSLFADGYTVAALDQIREVQSGKRQLTRSSLIVGGFSAGGAVAIGYAEHLLASGRGQRLRGVFAIDPPLDLRRIYAYAERKISYRCDLISKEGHSLKKHLDRALGGSPESRPGRYLASSPFSSGAADGGNARVLRDIPVRLYSETDLAAVKKTYCAELQPGDINAYDLERLSRFLVASGNTRSEYITTQGRGFHSWNILEPHGCVEWIIRITD